MMVLRSPEPGASSSTSWLAASWARAHLRDLEDRYAVSARPDLEQQIVRVSRQHGVLSRFTAFVAVDGDRGVGPGGRPRQVVQRAEPPAGARLRRSTASRARGSGARGGLKGSQYGARSVTSARRSGSPNLHLLALFASELRRFADLGPFTDCNIAGLRT